MLRRILAILRLSLSPVMLAAAVLVPFALPAYASLPTVVISQVYGGGGNANAIYTNDFVELFNRGQAPVNLAGWTVQYSSATGSSWATSFTILTGTIPPGGYFLIQQAFGGAVGASLPAADLVGTIALGSAAGKVALVSNSTPLTGACPTDVAIVDFVGYGTSANCFEGGGAAPVPSATTSVSRAANGCSDTDANAIDFSVGAPDPRNSATSVHVCALSTGSPNIVINQVYGGGGNSGANYLNDFVELFNRGQATIDVGGWTIQYASAAGTFWATTPLSGSIPPGGYFLIQELSGGAVGAPLPTPDVVGGLLQLSATAGKVALVSNATVLSGACPAGGAIVDFVGYGTTADCFEGGAPTPVPSNSTSVWRAALGCTDTDDNALDFTAEIPVPRNSATSPHDCLPHFNVTPSAGLNGAIAPGGVQSIAQGATTHFTVTPDAGYFTASVGGSCGGALIGTDYTTNAISMDCTVDASFTPALALVAVKSRKLHAAASQDLTLNTGLGDPLTVEPRLIGAGHSIVFQFNLPITNEGVPGVVDGTAAPVGFATAARAGNDVVVTITNVADNQRVTVSLTGVNGGGNFSAPIGFLAGDVNGSHAVNAADISAVKANVNKTVDSSTYKFDLNANGSVTPADVSAVKARSGLVLPP